jgi:hypothetical protein
MITCRFTGTISPPEFTIRGAELSAWTSDKKRDLKIHHVVRFAGPIVTVTMDLSRYDVVLVDNLRARALEMARAQLSALMIATGRGYSLILDTFIDPTGVSYPLFTFDGELATIFAQHCPNCQVQDILKLTMGIDDFQHALTDLAAMLVDPFIIQINGARVLEAIRKAITPVAENETSAQRTVSWAALRDSLRVTRAFLVYVTNASLEARHGERNRNNNYNEMEVRKRCWIVMCRFLEFLARGRQPLTDFDLVDGETVA